MPTTTAPTGLSLSTIQQTLESGASGPKLGSLFWWNLRGNSIAHDDLVALAAKHMLPPEYLPGEITPESAFRRAWQSLKPGLPAGILLREISEAAGPAVVVGKVKEVRDEAARRLDYAQLNSFVFEKATFAIGAVDDTDELFGPLVEAYTSFSRHTSTDIRRMIAAFCAQRAFSLRAPELGGKDPGGVYFVPSQFGGLLASLSGVLKECGLNSTSVLNIYAGPNSEATAVLATAALASLTKELTDMSDAFEKASSRKMRDSTLTGQIADFDALRARTELFAGALSFEASGLRARISKLRERVLETLEKRALLDSGGFETKLAPVSLVHEASEE